MESRKIIITWIAVTVAVMFALPFVVARFASECSGMALCMILLIRYILLYWDSVVVGIYTGCGICLWYRLSLFLPERGYSLTLWKCGLSYMPQFI